MTVLRTLIMSHAAQTCRPLLLQPHVSSPRTQQSPQPPMTDLQDMNTQQRSSLSPAQHVHERPAPHCRAAWQGRQCCLRRLGTPLCTHTRPWLCRVCCLQASLSPEDSTPGVSLLVSCRPHTVLSPLPLPLLLPGLPSRLQDPSRPAGPGMAAAWLPGCCCWLLMRGDVGVGCRTGVAVGVLVLLHCRLLLLLLPLLTHGSEAELLPAGSCCWSWFRPLL